MGRSIIGILFPIFMIITLLGAGVDCTTVADCGGSDHHCEGNTLVQNVCTQGSCMQDFRPCENSYYDNGPAVCQEGACARAPDAPVPTTSSGSCTTVSDCGGSDHHCEGNTLVQNVCSQGSCMQDFRPCENSYYDNGPAVCQNGACARAPDTAGPVISESGCTTVADCGGSDHHCEGNTLVQTVCTQGSCSLDFRPCENSYYDNGPAVCQEGACARAPDSAGPVIDDNSCTTVSDCGGSDHHCEGNTLVQTVCSQSSCVLDFRPCENSYYDNGPAVCQNGACARAPDTTGPVISESGCTTVADCGGSDHHCEGNTLVQTVCSQGSCSLDFRPCENSYYDNGPAVCQEGACARAPDTTGPVVTDTGCTTVADCGGSDHHCEGNTLVQTVCSQGSCVLDFRPCENSYYDNGPAVCQSGACARAPDAPVPTTSSGDCTTVSDCGGSDHHCEGNTLVQNVCTQGSCTLDYRPCENSYYDNGPAVCQEGACARAPDSTGPATGGGCTTVADCGGPAHHCEDNTLVQTVCSQGSCVLDLRPCENSFYDNGPAVCSSGACVRAPEVTSSSGCTTVADCGGSAHHCEGNTLVQNVCTQGACMQDFRPCENSYYDNGPAVCEEGACARAPDTSGPVVTDTGCTTVADCGGSAHHCEGNTLVQTVCSQGSCVLDFRPCENSYYDNGPAVCQAGACARAPDTSGPVVTDTGCITVADCGGSVHHCEGNTLVQTVCSQGSCVLDFRPCENSYYDNGPAVCQNGACARAPDTVGPVVDDTSCTTVADCGGSAHHCEGNTLVQTVCASGECKLDFRPCENSYYDNGPAVCQAGSCARAPDTAGPVTGDGSCITVADCGGSAHHCEENTLVQTVCASGLCKLDSRPCEDSYYDNGPAVCSSGACVRSSDSTNSSIRRSALDALILATTINYPDAIVAEAAGTKMGVPVLLTPSDALPEDVAAFIAEERPEKIIILGGTYVISPAIEESLTADGFDVIRLWGMTRFGTAAELATYSWDAGVNEAVVVYDRIEGAEGDEHAQLVMAKSLAAARVVPILLTSNEELSTATKEALEELGVEKVTLVGTRFAEGVLTALKYLGAHIDVVTGETVEEVNEKLQEEVVEELQKSLPDEELTRLVVVAAGTDYRASITLTTSTEATASMVLLNEGQIPGVVSFIEKHGIKEVTVIGIPELTSKVVGALLLIEGLEVRALSTKDIEKGVVDRLKERKGTWNKERRKKISDHKRELAERGHEMRGRTEHAIEKATKTITGVVSALDELKAAGVPEQYQPVLTMFSKEVTRAQDLVERARAMVDDPAADGEDFAEAFHLLKKAEGVAREAKYKGMKMIAKIERDQRELEAANKRKERDAMAEELLGDMETKENLRDRILGKGERLAEIRERVKEDRDRGAPGENRFGPSLEGREIGPRFDKDRFRKKDLSKRSFGKDFSLRGADPCKRCIKKCGDEEQGPECAFICADTCGKSPCELCNEYCPEEIDDPRMCPIICGEVCRMADEVADFRGFKSPRSEDGRESSGLTCCQPDRGASTPACIVDLGQPCPNRYRPLEDEWVDPFNDGNCIGDKGDRGPRCEEFDLSDAPFPEDGGRYRDDYRDEDRFMDDDRWLPPPDLPPKHRSGDLCRECVDECFAKGEDGAECGFICERPCGVDACDICEKGCRINDIPPAECHNTCRPACEEPEEFDYDEGSQCDRCVDDCMEELGNLDECSGICEDACHRDPCSVCEGQCPRVLDDASECHDTCGMVCGRPPSEPEGPDPITLCRDQCKGQRDAGACMQFCIRRWDKEARAGPRSGQLPESGPSDDTVRSALMKRTEAEFRGSNRDERDTDLREDFDERYTSIGSRFGNASVARGWRNTLVGLDLVRPGGYQQWTSTTTEYTYDVYGRISATRETVTSNESPDKVATRTTSFKYDSLGEVLEIRETVTGGTGQNETTLTDIRRDDEGRVTGFQYTEGTGEFTVTGISYDDYGGEVTSYHFEDATGSVDVGEIDITDIRYDDVGRMTGYRHTVMRAGSTLERICGDGTCTPPFENARSCPVDCG
ncbi:MAG: cell wall-binding repeat-containing protein [Candidatus Undinarchaeales archaeon]|nr:cell wall-binding repeat-containing protein [Candidatus Undinarchaeales archaeon]